MNCKKCGNKINENEHYCSKCGSPLDNEAAATPMVIYDAKAQNQDKETCPACGSHQIRFVSHTQTSSGYHAGSGCCGYILLGPLGLLCGLSNQNSTTTTERECRNCGKRF